MVSRQKVSRLEPQGVLAKFGRCIVGFLVVISLSVIDAHSSVYAQDSTSATFRLAWEPLPALPTAEGQTEQLGLAGPFVGLHNDVLIVAGGANFPHGAPWDEPNPSIPRAGKKIYWDDIFVLSKTQARASSASGQDPANSSNYQWQKSTTRLPSARGYGVALSTSWGVICIGGEAKPFIVDDTGKQTQMIKRFADVFLLQWNPNTKQIDVSETIPTSGEKQIELPDLPTALTAMSGAVIKDVVYVAGGDSGQGATNHFWSLDLSEPTGAPLEWKELPSWPGPPRVLPIAAAQNDGVNDCFYLFSGRETAPGKTSNLLKDCFRYNPVSRQWKRVSDAPRCLMAGTGIGTGVHHVLAFGGDGGSIFERLERLSLSADADSAAEIVKIQSSHPGFNRDVLAYHTVTDTWIELPDLLPEGGSHVTTNVVDWNGTFVIPTGEVRPAVRSANVWQGRITRTPTFGTVNYAVLIVYLGALVLMGAWFSRRMKTTEDFFKAGQRIPWWAAGISIFGTQLSAITFMAIPAKAYATDWRLLIANLMIVAAAPLVVMFFLPFFRRLDVTTAYEYLERRFNRPIRLLASGMFILMQFGRIGIVLLLPSIALSVVTGIDVRSCILTMGVLCILYTVLGGIEAVIWTDVLQVVVLIGGALLCLVLIPNSIEGGWNEMIQLGEDADRFRLLDFRLGWKEPTFFVILFGAFAQNLISYGSDQTVIQRYLTTRDEATARQSIWTAAILAIPASLLFFMMGAALFAFFKTHPGQLDPGLQQADAIFPHYIVNCLPAGVAGLVIAAIFAAAMSSLDSSMNSVAAAVTADFYRGSDSASSRGELWIARCVTVLVGICGTLFAIWMSNQPDIKSLWDAFAEYLGLFGGGLCGLFFLAIFTQRTSAAAALIGLLASALIQFGIRQAGIFNPWLYSATGLVGCFVVGYLAAIALPNRRDLSGLTFKTL